jgi:hypothetical protein
MTNSHTENDSCPAPLRPRDLAVLLLASGDLRPRQRARDQQADAAGLALKREVLEALAALDPEPAELATVLEQIVQDHGPPHGPTRAVAASVRDDWLAAVAAPGWCDELLHAALHHAEKA